MEGEWLCYGSGQFNIGRMVMLQRWSQMEGEWLSYTGVVSLVEGEWLC